MNSKFFGPFKTDSNNFYYIFTLANSEESEYENYTGLNIYFGRNKVTYRLNY